MRYLAGFGVHAQEDVAQSPSAVRFLHGDLTRSTMMTTDTSATVLSRVAYTAFGDPVAWDSQSESWRVGWPVDMGTRYQYDGGWGYESGAWGPGPGGQGAVGGPLALWDENTVLPLGPPLATPSPLAGAPCIWFRAAIVINWPLTPGGIVTCLPGFFTN